MHLRPYRTTLLCALAGVLCSIASLFDSALAQVGVPALSVTAPNGATSVIIGTLHVPYPGIRQPAMSVLRGAKRLVVESSWTQGPQPIGLRREEALDEEVLAGRTNRASWAIQLTDAQVGFLQQRLACYTPAWAAATTENLLQQKSPRMAAGFVWMPCVPAGAQSRDAILAAAARHFNVPELPLDNPVDVENRRRAVPDRIYLRQLMAGLDASNQSHDFELAVAAFNRGDYAEIASISGPDRGFPDDAALYHRLMVHDRNLAWMPVLRRALDAGDAVVAVGAAHLPGHDGLIELLQKDGYQVRETTLPSDRGLELPGP